MQIVYSFRVRTGGGLGGTRRGGPDVNIKHSGREDNERERERYRLEREREDRRPDFRADRGGDRFQRRSRSPRVRERERDRRSRSRDRKKRRSRSREEVDRRERDRSDRGDRREKEKKRKRSRSRDRDRSERKRDKRDKERDHRERKERKPDFRGGEIKIKEEPVDGECNSFEFFLPHVSRKLPSTRMIQNNIIRPVEFCNINGTHSTCHNTKKRNAFEMTGP